MASLVTPSLSSVQQPTFEIGEMAARFLIDEIEHGPGFVPKIKLFKTTLIKRESTKKIRLVAKPATKPVQILSVDDKKINAYSFAKKAGNAVYAQ